MVYGYCRISRKSQNISRQERNILAVYPQALIVKEAFTGTKIQGRKGLDALLKRVKKDDTIVFDSASRMSRNADEAMNLYEELFNKGVNLVFLRESHINTDVYKRTLQNQMQISCSTGSLATDNLVSNIVDALNLYTMELAKEQVRIVFEQAQKEVDDLQIRTSQGLLTAKINGKQIGRAKGATVVTKKSKEAKAKIVKYSKDFEGTLSDADAIKLIGISRNTFYKYKAQLRDDAV